MTTLSITSKVTPQVQTQKHISKIPFKGSIMLTSKLQDIAIIPNAENALFQYDHSTIKITTTLGNIVLDASKEPLKLMQEIFEAVKKSKKSKSDAEALTVHLYNNN